MQKKTGFSFKTIKAKVLLVGVVALISALILGNMGLWSLKKSISSNEMSYRISQISSMQRDNKLDDTLYQYYVDDTYLDLIIANYEEMEAVRQILEPLCPASFSDELSSLSQYIKQGESNYTELKNIYSSRGYTSDKGLYAQFETQLSAHKADLEGLVTTNDWVEIKWIDANMGVNGQHVTIEGKDYYKMVYDKELPVTGKRNNLVLRVGGTFTYTDTFYFTNIRFVNGNDVMKVDFSNLETTNCVGDGMASCEITTFNGEPAVKIVGKYNANNNTWEEIQAYVPLTDYDNQNYPVLQYDLYFDNSSNEFGYKYGGAVTGLYGFTDQASEIDETFAKYNQLVVEGNDVTEIIETLKSQMADLKTNIPKFAVEKSLSDAALASFTTFESTVNQIIEKDKQTLALSAENTELNVSLLALCDELQMMASSNLSSVQSSANVMILSVIIILAIALVLITTIIARRLDGSVKSFKGSIDKMCAGDITERIETGTRDEFSLFGDSINNFLDTLQGTIKDLQKMANVLDTTGNELETRAANAESASNTINEALGDISKGATEQAGDIESSSQQVINMCTNINEIIDHVEALSDTSNQMNEESAAASEIMEALKNSNEKTTIAFDNIAVQIHKTNDSVIEIQDAVNLIASIASQTNLLSLNASIEAARAGEAGRGFAVVATEIQKLAEQTNSSANIINQIITTLSAESENTVAAINEVTEMVEVQKTNLSETLEKFQSVRTGITNTEEEMRRVIKQADVCKSAGEKVVDLMNNLSAIAEENAASTEQTSSSMLDLNKGTSALAGTASDLKKVSEQINTNLGNFTV